MLINELALLIQREIPETACLIADDYKTGAGVAVFVKDEFDRLSKDEWIRRLATVGFNSDDTEIIIRLGSEQTLDIEAMLDKNLADLNLESVTFTTFRHPDDTKTAGHHTYSAAVSTTNLDLANPDSIPTVLRMIRERLNFIVAGRPTKD